MVSFRNAPVAREQVEGPAHLGERRGGDLQIETGGVDLAEGQARHEDVPQKVAVGRCAGEVEQLGDEASRPGPGCCPGVVEVTAQPVAATAWLAGTTRP